jgi:hypothetical protein
MYGFMNQEKLYFNADPIYLQRNKSRRYKNKEEP